MTSQRRIHAKPILYRRAIARGELRLRPATRAAIRARSIEKGDPILVGELAGLAAMKRTDELIPHSHVVALSGSRVEIRSARSGVVVEAEAEAVGRTGVELEALVGATIALLTVWDMVKYLEKDARGQYATARIDGVRVTLKQKRPMGEGGP
jgi:cyclic pyranopterin phosphate synthase